MIRYPFLSNIISSYASYDIKTKSELKSLVNTWFNGTTREKKKLKDNIGDLFKWDISNFPDTKKEIHTLYKKYKLYVHDINKHMNLIYKLAFGYFNSKRFIQELIKKPPNASVDHYPDSLAYYCCEEFDLNDHDFYDIDVVKFLLDREGLNIHLTFPEGRAGFSVHHYLRRLYYDWELNPKQIKILEEIEDYLIKHNTYIEYSYDDDFDESDSDDNRDYRYDNGVRWRR